MRRSPSLVGRGIANPMSAKTRGFKSPSPRLYFSKKLNTLILLALIWDEEKHKKL